MEQDEDQTPPEPVEPRLGQVHERTHRGVRLVGVWLPWQAVVGILVIVGGVSAIAALRSDRGALRVEQASNVPAEAPAVVTTTTLSEPSSALAPIVTPTAAAPVETTTTALPRVAAAPAATTVPQPTTTTTRASGHADSMIFSNNYGGPCHTPTDDWLYPGSCQDGQPRADTQFMIDPKRYPSYAEYRVEVAVGADPDVRLCMRVFDLDMRSGVAGSEKCWVGGPVEGHGRQEFIDRLGPMTVSPDNHRYTFQWRVHRNSSGEPCHANAGQCSAGFSKAKLLVEWR